MRVEVAPAIASPQVLKPDVPELDPNSFYDFIQESSDSLVVVDWYTGELVSGRWPMTCTSAHGRPRTPIRHIPRLKK